MEVEFGLGALVDIASGKELKEQGDELKRLLRGLADPRGRSVPRVESITVATGKTTAVISLGGPPPGKVWHARRWAVCASDAFTVPSGVLCASFVGAAASGGSLDGLIDPGASLPNSARWSHDEVVIRQSQQLYFLLTGVAAGQTYLANATMTEEDA